MYNVEGNLYVVLCTKSYCAAGVKEDKLTDYVTFVRDVEIASGILVTNL